VLPFVSLDEEKNLPHQTGRYKKAAAMEDEIDRPVH
jgi:hypothetical protein